MKKYNVLILTDHSNHSRENSLYALVNAMLRHQLTNKIDIASRANIENNPFFRSEGKAPLSVTEADKDFTFTSEGLYLSGDLKLAELRSYDLIWMRMPPPLDKEFLNFLDTTFRNQFVINDPKGIYITGSKEFLCNFSSLCPPMKICKTKDDIIEFASQFPVVLKPLREYGGKGIVKINGNKVLDGSSESSIDDFIKRLTSRELPYLAVKFLKNVSKGDKRIVVVNGKILGAALRLPPQGSWICNVAMGGSYQIAEVDEEEREMIYQINPVLTKLGIAMYGIDTLVGDDGKRMLSEINTTSIGGLKQLETFSKLPLVEKAIELIWSYFLKYK